MPAAPMHFVAPPPPLPSTRLAAAFAVAVFVACVVPVMGVIMPPRHLVDRNFRHDKNTGFALHTVPQESDPTKPTLFRTNDPPLTFYGSTDFGSVEGCTSKTKRVYIVLYTRDPKTPGVKQSLGIKAVSNRSSWDSVVGHLDHSAGQADAAGLPPEIFAPGLPTEAMTWKNDMGATLVRAVLKADITIVPQRGAHVDGGDNDPEPWKDQLRLIVPDAALDLTLTAEVFPNAHGVGPITATEGAKAVELLPGQTLSYPIHLINPSRAQAIRLLNADVPDPPVWHSLIADVGALGTDIFLVPPFSRSALLATLQFAMVEPGVYEGHVAIEVEGCGTFRLWYNVSVVRNDAPKINLGVLRSPEQQLTTEVPFTHPGSPASSQPLAITDVYIAALPQPRREGRLQDTKSIRAAFMLDPEHKRAVVPTLPVDRHHMLFAGRVRNSAHDEDDIPFPRELLRCIVVKPRFGTVAQPGRRAVAALLTVFGPACAGELQKALYGTDSTPLYIGGVKRLVGDLVIRLNGTAPPAIPDRAFQVRFAIDLVIGNVTTVAQPRLFDPQVPHPVLTPNAPKIVRTLAAAKATQRTAGSVALDISGPAPHRAGPRLMRRTIRYDNQWPALFAVYDKRDHCNGIHRNDCTKGSDLPIEKDPDVKDAEFLPVVPILHGGLNDRVGVARVGLRPDADYGEALTRHGEAMLMPFAVTTMHATLGFNTPGGGIAQVPFITELAVARLPFGIVEVDGEVYANETAGANPFDQHVDDVHQGRGTDYDDRYVAPSLVHPLHPDGTVAAAEGSVSAMAPFASDPELRGLPDDVAQLARASVPAAAAKLLLRGSSLVHSLHFGVIYDGASAASAADNKPSPTDGAKGGKQSRSNAKKRHEADVRARMEDSQRRSRRVLHLVNPHPFPITVVAVRLDKAVSNRPSRHGIYARLIGTAINRTSPDGPPRMVAIDSYHFNSGAQAASKATQAEPVNIGVGESATLIVEHRAVPAATRKLSHTAASDYGTFEGHLHIDATRSAEARTEYFGMTVPVSFSFAPVETGLRFELSDKGTVITFPWAERTEDPATGAWVVERNVTVTSTLPFDLPLSSAFARAPAFDGADSMPASPGAEHGMLHDAFAVDLKDPVIRGGRSNTFATVQFHPASAAAARRARAAMAEGADSHEAAAAADLRATRLRRSGALASGRRSSSASIDDLAPRQNPRAPVPMSSSLSTLAWDVPRGAALPVTAITFEEVDEHEERVKSAVHRDRAQLVLQSGASSWVLSLAGECGLPRFAREAVRVAHASTAARASPPLSTPLHVSDVETVLNVGAVVVDGAEAKRAVTPSSALRGVRSVSSGGLASADEDGAAAVPSTARFIKVRNPLTTPIAVQPLLLADATDDEGRPLPRDLKKRLQNAAVRTARHLSQRGGPKFAGEHGELTVTAYDAWTASTSAFGVETDAATTVIVAPGETARIGPVFMRRDACRGRLAPLKSGGASRASAVVSSVILLRNNDTLFEAVRLEGTCVAQLLDVKADAVDSKLLAVKATTASGEFVANVNVSEKWADSIAEARNAAPHNAYPTVSTVLRHLGTLGSTDMADGQPRATVRELLAARLVSNHYVTNGTNGSTQVAPALAGPTGTAVLHSPVVDGPTVIVVNTAPVPVRLSHALIEGQPTSCGSTGAGAAAISPCFGTADDASELVLAGGVTETAAAIARAAKHGGALGSLVLQPKAMLRLRVSLAPPARKIGGGDSTAIFVKLLLAHSIADADAAVASAYAPVTLRYSFLASSLVKLEGTTTTTAGEALAFYSTTLVVLPLLCALASLWWLRRRPAASADRGDRNAAPTKADIPRGRSPAVVGDRGTSAKGPVPVLAKEPTPKPAAAAPTVAGTKKPAAVTKAAKKVDEPSAAEAAAAAKKSSPPPPLPSSSSSSSEVEDNAVQADPVVSEAPTTALTPVVVAVATETPTTEAKPAAESPDAEDDAPRAAIASGPDAGETQPANSAKQPPAVVQTKPAPDARPPPTVAPAPKADALKATGATSKKAQAEAPKPAPQPQPVKKPQPAKPTTVDIAKAPISAPPASHQQQQQRPAQQLQQVKQAMPAGAIAVPAPRSKVEPSPKQAQTPPVAKKPTGPIDYAAAVQGKTAVLKPVTPIPAPPPKKQPAAQKDLPSTKPGAKAVPPPQQQQHPKQALAPTTTTSNAKSKQQPAAKAVVAAPPARDARAPAVARVDPVRPGNLAQSSVGPPQVVTFTGQAANIGRSGDAATPQAQSPQALLFGSAEPSPHGSHPYMAPGSSTASDPSTAARATPPTALAGGYSPAPSPATDRASRTPPMAERHHQQHQPAPMASAAAPASDVERLLASLALGGSGGSGTSPTVPGAPGASPAKFAPGPLDPAAPAPAAAAPAQWSAPGAPPAGTANADFVGGGGAEPQIEFNFGLPGQSDFFEGIFKGSALSIYEDEEA